jgi:hypothetical protein
VTGRRTLVAGMALLAVTIAVVLGLVVGRAAPVASPGPSISGSPSTSGGSPSPAAGITLIATSHVGGAYDIALTHTPTAGQPQSKLWFAEDAWWATLIDPATQELHIARLDPATQAWTDTGTLIDDRPHVRADALWDGTHLTVVSAGPKATANQSLRIAQFQFDARTGRFEIDPDLPITLTAAGVSDPVLARDSKGILWLAYVDQARLILRHSVGNVWHWSPAAVPPVSGAAGAIRAAALTADGSRVTVAWNRVDDDTLSVGQHIDGADPGTWAVDSVHVPGLANAPGGFSIRSVAADAGSRVFVAFELAPDRSANANPLAPGAVVMVRETDGSWSNVQLARVKDHFSTPVLAIDDRGGTLVAIAFVTSSGTIAFKQSPLDNVSFESGGGTDLIASSADPGLRDPTTTKQAIDLTSGLIVLGADDGTGHYAFGRLATTAGTAVGSPAPSGPSSSPPPIAAGAGTILLHDTFAPWAVGTRLPAEWPTTAEGRGSGVVAVAGAPGPSGRSLLVRTLSFLGSIRSCTSFAPTGTSITVSEVFELTAVGGSDTPVSSIRGPGGEAASVRVTRHGLLAFYNGQIKVTTALAIRPGVWYRVMIVTKPASHTYDLAIVNAAGRLLYRTAGVHWRQAGIPALDTFCAQSPQARGGAILIDELEVRR